jgi:hypothetical protein
MMFFIMAQIGVNDAAASPGLFGLEIRSLLDADACDAIRTEPTGTEHRAPSTEHRAPSTEI